MKPRIAVLVPAYNEEVVIADTIKALFIAGCDKSDIYIADDRSTDATAKIARSYDVNIITTPKNGGKAAAQRCALRYFLLRERYDYVVFMDGDTLVDPNFLLAFRSAIKETPDVSLYVGQLKSIKNDHIFSALRAIEYAFSHDIVKTGQSNFNVVYVAPGCASMYSSIVLQYLHIDSDTLAEDMDLTLQVHQLDKKVQYVPSAIVHTQDPSTFKDYMKQIYRWYRGFWQVVQKHKIFRPSFVKRRVHWYMIYMTLDSLLLNRIAAAALFTHMNSSIVAGLAFDFACYVLMGLYAAFRTRRMDILYKIPMAYLISCVSLYAFIRSFVEIIVLRRNPLTWNKVSRYTIA